MKRKIIILLIAAVLLLSAFTSCTYVPEVAGSAVTRITLEAGAAVELMINKDNIVAVATPLNEEAFILLADEDLLKLSPDKAADKFITLALKSGFNGSEVKLSISGRSDYVDVITEMIEKKIEKRLKKFKVDATINMVAPATSDELSELCLADGFYTEEEVSYMMEEEKIYYLALARRELSFLPTPELRALYSLSRATNIAIYTAEGTLGVLEGIKDEYPEAYEAYAGAFALLKESASALEEAAREVYLGSAEVDISTYYTDLEAKKAALAAIEGAFDKEVTVAIRSAYVQTQTALFEKRNAFPAKFYEQYESDIKAAKNALIEKKNDLIK